MIDIVDARVGAMGTDTLPTWRELSGGITVKIIKERYRYRATGGTEGTSYRGAVARCAVGSDDEAIVGICIEACSSVSGVADTTHHSGVAAIIPIGHGVGDATVHLVRPNDGDFCTVGSLQSEVAQRIASVVFSDRKVVNEYGVLS